MRRCIRGILAGALLLLVSIPSRALDITSIQLVGDFKGATCEPNDPANNMQPLGDHVWRKLVFIDEPGSPDTIFFKFTRDGSYLPEHWGWSGVWGIAELSWSPPNIAAILPDSGYHCFYFRDSDYAYWIERPAGSISGLVTADGRTGVPPKTRIVLYDSLSIALGTYDAWSGDTYLFDNLCASVYHLSAHAPGYRDTLITGVRLGLDEAKDVPIHLTQVIGVLIASAECRRIEGGVMITWCTMCCGGYAAFDVYRGFAPDFLQAQRRNAAPVRADRIYEYFDPCDDPSKDLYYYLVELGDDDPTRFGPLFVKGLAVAGFLGQNFPNPFNPSTTIPFTVSSAGAGKPITFSFYDVSGRLVESHNLGAKPAGNYSFRWNPAARTRGDFPSGVYYCRMTIDKETYTRKLILLR